jgi:hypothetical protein
VRVNGLRQTNRALKGLAYEGDEEKEGAEDASSQEKTPPPPPPLEAQTSAAGSPVVTRSLRGKSRMR